MPLGFHAFTGRMRENGGQGVIKVVGTNLSERARPGRSNVRAVLVIEFERALSVPGGVLELCGCSRVRTVAAPGI